jgi:tetratricopeptide (TPR) repeat protein
MNRLHTLGDFFLRAPQLWLLVLCVLVFGRGLDGGFVMDDGPVIHENSKITELKYIPGYFTRDVWGSTDLAEQTGINSNVLYRPLFLVTLNLGHHLWGDSALGYHALNLVLHGINTLLVFYLIAGLAGGRAPALLGAAIFAVHPVHVESIAWAAGLTDPLVSLFLLGAFLLHRRNVQNGGNGYALGAVLCYAAGLLSKEVAVFFPVLLVIHDGLHGQVRVKRYLPYVAVLAAYFIARGAALGNAIDGSRFDLSHWPVLLEFITRYTQLLIAPWPLEYYYDPPARNLFAIGIGAAALLAAAIYLPRALRNRQAMPVLAVAWFAVTLLPALPIALMSQPVFAIRVLYLPSVGIALLLAWLFQVMPVRTAANALLVGLIALLGVVSFMEIADWRDNATFYGRASETSPRAFQPYVGLADAYERNGDYRKAIEFNRKASELATRERDKLDTLEKAAELAGQHGDTANSENYYREILQRAPRRSSAWVGLGNNALARRDSRQALEFYLNAYQADPANFVASYNLALVYRNLGEMERAAYFENIYRRLGR